MNPMHSDKELVKYAGVIVENGKADREKYVDWYENDDDAMLKARTFLEGCGIKVESIEIKNLPMFDSSIELTKHLICKIAS